MKTFLSFLSSIHEFFIISRSGLFDKNYYLEKYKDVAKTNTSPLMHYIREGWLEGRDPSPTFSTHEYLQANPDVAQQKKNPLVHYIEFGKKEKRPLQPQKNSNHNSTKVIGEKKNRYMLRNNFIDTIKNKELFATTLFEQHTEKASIPDPTLKVSIVLPTHNQGWCVGDAIHSVVSQTWQNWELIIIDDESTDDTLLILEEFLHDPRVHVHRIRRSGVSDARNAGLTLASGDFLAFIDADNIWNPNFLKTMLTCMERDQADAARSAFYAVTDHVAIYHCAVFNDNMLRGEKEYDLGTLMLRRASLGDIRFDSMLYRAVDYDFFKQITQRSTLFHYNFPGQAYFAEIGVGRIADLPVVQYEYIQNKYHPYVDWEQMERESANRISGMVSIIIPFVSGEQLTIACIESIILHTSEVHYEIILVDNGAPEATSRSVRNACRGEDNIIYIKNNENLQFSMGNNIGFAASHGEFVCFLNNDTTVTPGWLKNLRQSMLDDFQIGFVAPLLILMKPNCLQSVGDTFPFFSKLPYRLYGTNYKIENWQQNRNILLKTRNVTTVVGACVLMNSKDFIAIQGFNPAFINGSEDTYLCIEVTTKLKKKGMFCHQSVVSHHESQSPTRGQAASLNIILYNKLIKNINLTADIASFRHDDLFPISYDIANKTPDTDYVLPYVKSVKLENLSLLSKEKLRLLIVKPSGIGNMLWSMPLILALRELCPQATIDVLCFPQEAQVAEKLADNVIVIQRTTNPFEWQAEMLERSRSMRYDIALLPPSTVGLNTPGLHNMAEHIMSHPWIDYTTKHEVELSFDLARMMGYEKPIPHWSYPIGKLPHDFIVPHRPFIAVHIGASASRNMQHKCWALPKWIALITALSLNYDVVLLGGPDEKEQLAELHQCLSPTTLQHITWASYPESLDATAAIIAQALCFIGIDGGITHLASFVETPLIMIIGSTSDIKGSPWCTPEKAQIVKAPEHVLCAPCYPASSTKIGACPHQACLEAISVSDVLNAFNDYGFGASVQLNLSSTCPVCGEDLLPGNVETCPKCKTSSIQRAVKSVAAYLPLEWSHGKRFEVAGDKPADYLSALRRVTPGSCDIVELDSILEFIHDDREAVRQIFRILSEKGLWRFTLRNAYRSLLTYDLTENNADGQLRVYGIEFYNRLAEAFPPEARLFFTVIIDPVSGREDFCYFATLDEDKATFFEKSPTFKELCPFSMNAPCISC